MDYKFHPISGRSPRRRLGIPRGGESEFTAVRLPTTCFLFIWFLIAWVGGVNAQGSAASEGDSDRTNRSDCPQKLLSSEDPDSDFPYGLEEGASFSGSPFSRSVEVIESDLRQVRVALIDWFWGTEGQRQGWEFKHKLILTIGASLTALERAAERLGQLRQGSEAADALHDLKNFFQLAQGALLQARMPYLPQAEAYTQWTWEPLLRYQTLTGEERERASGLLRQALAAVNECLALTQSLVFPNQPELPVVLPLDLDAWLSRLKTLYPQLRAPERPARAWTVNANPDRLIRAVANLVSNAKQAGATEASIDFALIEKFHDFPREKVSHFEREELSPRQRSGHYLGFRVKDSAGGMSPEAFKALFVRGVSQHSHQGGTGLGLHSVRTDTLEIGGFVEVVSVPQQGSEFTLWLPLLGIEVAEPSTAQPPSEGRRQVVLIDDMRHSLMIMERFCQSAGLEAVTFPSRRLAAAHIAQNPESVGVVVTDLSTGSSDITLEALLELTRQHPHTKVLIASGDPVDELPVGVEQALTKPLNFGDFTKRLQELLD